ncbi:MAG: insulinase family protein [Candidatus Symbiothrix sp.]|jgi:predicted Zn-dependent peptidase|nr:insulinase family protein [Candidatus Symbiothrix sp.]
MKTIYSFIFLLLSVLTLNAQSLDRSVRPSSAPAKEINIKDAQIFTLSNGLKVFLVEDKTTPIVYYSLQLDVEPALEGDKAGLSSMFADVIGKATLSRSKEQLNKDIDMIGARVSMYTDGAYVSFLKKYESKALEIFADMLLNPVFLPEEFTLTRDKYNTFMQSLGDDAGQLNERVSAVLTYGKGYPDGEIETKESINNVQLGDLEKYYKTYFAPNVSRLVIVGDVSLKEAKANVQKYFSAWKKKNVPVTKYEIPALPENVKVAYVVKPGAVQSAIDISYPIHYQLGTPDYDAALVMDYILGGSATSRFFLNLREKHSYTYGVYSDLSPDEHIGRFNLTSGRGAASVKAAATDSAVYELFNELNRIITEPVTADELKAAKTYLAGSFSRSLEQAGTIANFAIRIDKYKLPKDYYKNYLKRLDAVTIEDVQKAAAKYIRPNNAWVVVAGDQSQVDKLLPFASDNTIHYFDYDAQAVEAPKTQAIEVSAEQIIAAYVQALGGEAAINKIEDYKTTAEIAMMGQVVNLNQLFKKPNRSLMEILMGETTIQRMAFDGKVLRVNGMGGSQEMTSGDEFEAIKNESAVVPEINYAANGYTLSVSGIEQINGQDAYILTVSKGENAQTSYFDVKSGLKVKNITTVQSQMGEQQTITEYADYREVNGVKFPFAMKQNTAGMVMDVTVKSVEINLGLVNSLFE